MNKNKLPTVTVGIAAFNEEQNIENILLSIIKQEKKSYSMEKIIVVSDGSSDNTDSIVKNLMKKYPYIKLVSDGKRKGQSRRLNQLYKMNMSEFIFNFDGDVVLSNKMVIEEMLQCFHDPKVVLVGGNKQPIKATTFVEKLVNTWFQVWYQVRKNVNNGNSVHNIGGCGIAMRKDFAKTVKLTKGIMSTVKFLYFSAAKSGYKFGFAKKAVIYYRSPNTLRDYLMQTKRAPLERKKIAECFGEWIYDQYKVPVRYKVAGLCKMMMREPGFTLLAGIFMWWVSTMSPFEKNPIFTESGTWTTVRSTKDAIRINY